MFRKPKPHDAGLEQIDAWHRWFLSAHAARLEENALPPDVRDRELATITAQAAAIVAQMRDAYLSNQSRCQP